eukprot:TRINITY_DN5720_c0_g1_i1.p1 TRINITY_DN5720_c0_g1~~TRINITY_DN5720_c0_g1_i1.p1  ORF type:complete len:710 (+),score=20.45 TRINITY_DN5720_c0_g1_i1:158-2287(+)
MFAMLKKKGYVKIIVFMTLLVLLVCTIQYSLLTVRKSTTTASKNLQKDSVSKSLQSNPNRIGYLYTNGRSSKNMFPFKFGTQQKVDQNRLLAFSTMNSFSLHRIGIVSSVLLAFQLQRVLVIPKNTFCIGGIACDEDYFYDQQVFLQSLQQIGISYQVIDGDINRDYFQEFECDQDSQPVCFQSLKLKQEAKRLFIIHPEKIAFPKDGFRQYKELLKYVFNGLVLSSKFENLKNKTISRIQFYCVSSNFSVVSIDTTKSDQDTVSKVKILVDGENAINTEDIISYGEFAALQVHAKQFEQNIPIYLWGNEQSTWQSESLNTLIRAFEEQKLSYVSATPILQDVQLSQEFILGLNYYVSLEGERFLGDGTLLINQLIVLERQINGKWASYFNQEILPLATIYPAFDIPWVFTHNSWSSKVDYLVKAVARSAIEVGKVTPYCLFSGDRNSEIARWLKDLGVTLIKHQPSWMAKLLMKNTKPEIYVDSQSHLFSNPEALVGAFLRIDIAILSELSQYSYVLYTDTDVYFRKRFDFADLPQPLPRTIGMGYEVDPVFPYNSGVCVMNMFGLNTNYETFVNFILSNERGIYFQGFGPLDQGALNNFYEVTIKNWLLPATFNGKPYFEFDNDTVILHFHGPKPHEYYQYMTTEYCRPVFNRLCTPAAIEGMCRYAIEWGKFSSDNDISQELVQLCKAKIAGEELTVDGATVNVMQ